MFFTIKIHNEKFLKSSYQVLKSAINESVCRLNITLQIFFFNGNLINVVIKIINIMLNHLELI